MHYSDILAKFFEMFPNYMGVITQWSPMGRKGIKLKTNSGQVIEFVYYNDNEWTLSAVHSRNRRD